MSAWADVNQVQKQIEKAEKDLAVLCADLKAAKVKCESKKEEIRQMYASQDNLIVSILGPRQLEEIWKEVK